MSVKTIKPSVNKLPSFSVDDFWIISKDVGAVSGLEVKLNSTGNTLSWAFDYVSKQKLSSVIAVFVVIFCSLEDLQLHCNIAVAQQFFKLYCLRVNSIPFLKQKQTKTEPEV